MPNNRKTAKDMQQPREADFFQDCKIEEQSTTDCSLAVQQMLSAVEVLHGYERISRESCDLEQQCPELPPLEHADLPLGQQLRQDLLEVAPALGGAMQRPEHAQARARLDARPDLQGSNTSLADTSMCSGSLVCSLYLSACTVLVSLSCACCCLLCSQRRDDVRVPLRAAPH